jgi:hypothetical protein
MLSQNIMLLSDEVGRIVSPTIKLILLVFMGIVAIKLFQKYKARKTVLALALMAMCFF